MRGLFFWLATGVWLIPLSAQTTASVVDSLEREDRTEIYSVNPLIEIPAAVLGGYLSQRRLISLQDKAPVTQEELEALNPDDVIGIDRIALRQDFSKHKNGILISDYLFNTGQWAPVGLFIWKKYRRDWLDITTMYLEAQATQGLFYGFAPFGPTQINRFRPRVYYEEAGFESRTDGNQRNSMFSGHVSTMATGFYFTAKIIDDYNPDMKTGHRVLLYTAASLPSIYGAAMRVKAVKHYPTDTAVGLAVGAISGILVPEIHTWWGKRHRSELSVRPIVGSQAGGGSVSLRF